MDVVKGTVLILYSVTVVTSAYKVECPSKSSSNNENLELVLPHEDCNKFYKCSVGGPIEQVCPTGLYYNIDIKQCDFLQSVDCWNRSNIKTDSENVVNDVNTHDRTGNDEQSNNNVLLRQKVSTEIKVAVKIFYKQGRGNDSDSEDNVKPEQESEEEVPEQGSKEDIDDEQKSEEKNESASESKENDESESESEFESDEEYEKLPGSDETEDINEPNEDEIEFQENGCPVDHLLHWLLPHEEECNLYYVCLWGEKVISRCPESLHFNKVIQICDWPHDAGCAVSFNKHLSNRHQ